MNTTANKRELLKNKAGFKSKSPEKNLPKKINYKDKTHIKHSSMTGPNNVNNKLNPNDNKNKIKSTKNSQISGGNKSNNKSKKSVSALSNKLNSPPNQGEIKKDNKMDLLKTEGNILCKKEEIKLEESKKEDNSVGGIQPSEMNID